MLHSPIVWTARPFLALNFGLRQSSSHTWPSYYGKLLSCRVNVEGVALSLSIHLLLSSALHRLVSAPDRNPDHAVAIRGADQELQVPRLD